MVSFVIPAHNEEAFLAPTIRAIQQVGLALGRRFEIVVVDDASTDETVSVANREGAIVMSVSHRQIAATRHAGATAASGDTLIFVDADTVVSTTVVEQALAALNQGAVGGAAIGVFDGALPFHARAMAGLWSGVARAASLTTGCFLFCSRAAYESVGGFDRSLYVFEDVALGRSLRRTGRVVILRDTVLTSGRNLRAHTLRDAGQMLFLLMRHRRGFFTNRLGLSYWYGDHR